MEIVFNDFGFGLTVSGVASVHKSLILKCMNPRDLHLLMHPLSINSCSFVVFILLFSRRAIE